MKIRAKLKVSTFLILLIGGIGFSLLSWFFLKLMLSHKYIQIVGFVLFMISLFFASASIYYLVKNEVISIEGDLLKQESFFGLKKSTYNLSKLKSYTEIAKENKYIKWEELDLLFLNGKVRITSSNLKLNEYYKIKNYLTNGIERNHSEETNWASKNSRNLGIGFVMVWSLFFLLFVNQDEQSYRIIDDSTTIQVRGTISQNPKINSSRRNKQKLDIKLNEYPDFVFKLKGQELKALQKDLFLTEVSKGDKLTLRIWKEAHSKKISRVQKLSFRDKHINYHQIEILGVSKDKKDYIPAVDANKLREEFHSVWNYYSLMALILFGIGFGLYLIISSRKAR